MGRFCRHHVECWTGGAIAQGANHCDFLVARCFNSPTNSPFYLREWLQSLVVDRSRLSRHMQAQHTAWRPLPSAGSCIGSMHGAQEIGACLIGHGNLEGMHRVRCEKRGESSL